MDKWDYFGEKRNGTSSTHDRDNKMNNDKNLSFSQKKIINDDDLFVCVMCGRRVNPDNTHCICGEPYHAI